jgi:hypothetical protein
LIALEIHSHSQCWVATFLEFVGFGLATSIEVVPRSAALLDHLQLCSACLRCALVLDMTLWLSCHHPSLLAKQPRQTQQHLFPVASGSLVFSPESSKRACFGVQLYRQWPSFFLRIRSPSSSGLDAGTSASVANFVGCGAKFGRKSTDCKTSPVDGFWDQV